MTHRAKFFHPDKHTNLPATPVVAVFVVWVVLGISGFWDHLQWLGTIPGWLLLAFFIGHLTHEAFELDKPQMKLYDEYWKLSDENRAALPKLTPEAIMKMTEQQRGKLLSEMAWLHMADLEKEAAIKALDPFPEDMVRAVRVQAQAQQVEADMLRKLRKELS